MGFISNIIFYKVGRRRGSRGTAQSMRRQFQEENDKRSPECVNYGLFCKSFGSCDGQECEYE